MAGLVNMTDAMLAQAGLTVSGRLPTAEGEIAITDLLYKQLNEYGFKYASGNTTKRVEAGELQKDGEGEKSIIGKTLRFKSSNNGYEFSYTVVGVVDTGFDYARYQSFLPSNEPSNDNEGNGITDMVLSAELENVLAYSFHALGFVMNEDIVKIAENTFVSRKELGTYMSGWNSSTYLAISRYAPEGEGTEGGKERAKIEVIVGGGGITYFPGGTLGGDGSGAAWQRNMHKVAKSETLAQLDITWFDGTPREVLGANEIVISEQVWREMQTSQANVTISATSFGALVDARFGNGAWAATDQNSNYADRLTQAYRRHYLDSEIVRVAANTDSFEQIKQWFASSVPEYTAPIEDAATLEAALRWYFFGEDGTDWRNEQANVGYGNFIHWEPLYNVDLNAFKVFLPQLNEMLGTSFESENWDRIQWTIRGFLNMFNANDESEAVSFTQFQDVLSRYYGYRDLVANNYFINNERFVADLIACEGLGVTQAEWDSYTDTMEGNIEQSKLYWAEQFYLNYFLTNYDYRDYEPYVTGAKMQSDFENMSKQMVLKLSGKTEAELMGTLTFERIVEDYKSGTTGTEKAYDFKIVGVFEDDGYNSDLVINDTLYNDYMTWYESNAGEHSYVEEIAPHEEGIWAFALAPLTADANMIEKLVTMSYDRETGLQFQMQNAVMNTLSNFNDFIETGAKIFLYVGLGFALFSALLLMNFIATSISYKKRDIGILRAVGARSSDVFKIFFSEALIIALINFVMAIVALVATTVVLNMWMRNSGINITLLNVGLRQIVLMLGVSVLVALLASFLPVNAIARKKPVDAIKDR